MAFNLGDRFEIYRLRYGISKLQSQIQQLIDNIPPHYITAFKSWKNPTTNALELPIDCLLENCQFDQNNAEASKTAHVILLETTVDRLLTFMQCFGVAVENVLRENNDLLDPSSDLARKTSAGIIAKKVGSLLINAVNAREVRLKILSEKFVEYSTQTDLEEIKTRNVCTECLINDQDIRNLHGFLSDLFDSRCSTPLPEILSEDVLRKFHTEAKVCSSSIVKRRDQIESSRKRIIELEASIESKYEILTRTGKKLQTVKERLIEEEANIAAAKVVVKDQEKQLAAFELTRNNSRNEHDRKTKELEDLRWTLKEKHERTAHLQEEITKTENLVEEEKNSGVDLIDELRNENEVLLSQIKEARSKLQNFADFDCKWSEKHKVLLDDIRDLRQKWSDSEGVLNEQRILLQSKEEEIAAIQGENEKLTKQIERKRIRQLESTQLRHLSEQKPRLPSLPQFSFGDTQIFDFARGEERSERFSVNDSGDCVFPAYVATPDVIPVFEQCWTIPEENEQEDTADTNTSFASLFADFLELPDVQGMPEWDLVNTPPDFGIETVKSTGSLPTSEFREEVRFRENVSSFTEEKSVVSRPSSSLSSKRSETRSVVSTKNLKVVSSSPQIFQREVAKKLSVSDTHRLILQRSQLTEASWVVNKPNARNHNKSKKKYDIKPFALFTVNQIIQENIVRL